MPGRRLLVIADNVEGGLGSAALAHARWFATQGWSVVIAAPGASAATEAASPASVVELPVPGSAFDLPGMRRAAAAVTRLVREQRPEVVHVHGLRSHALTVAGGRRRPFVTAHGAGGRIPGQSTAGTLVRSTYRRLAPLVAREAFSAAPVPGWRTLLIASPSLPGPVPAVPEGGVPTFLWVGRMAPPKLPLLFVDALAALSRVREVRGVMLGDGPLLEQVRGRIAATGAPVTAPGASDDVSGELARSAAVCLFSDFEGIPFALQEAMWAGRAVVASPLPSIRWFAGEVPAYASDVDEVVAALRELCVPGRAAERGAAAAVRVRTVLDEQAPHPQLLERYLAEIGKGEGAP